MTQVTKYHLLVAGVIEAIVLTVIIVVIMLTVKNEKKDELPMYTATCSLIEYTMGKLFAVSCDVKVPTDADEGIDVSRTSFALNGVNLSPVNCTFQSTVGELACQGSMVSCQFSGTLSMSLSDSDGNVVLEKTLMLSSPDHPMHTSVVQVFEPVDQNLTSVFNFTCSVTSACNRNMVLYVGETVYFTQDDATFCSNTPMTDLGYSKSCVFDVTAEVILQQRSMDISCGVVAKRQYYHLPTCLDRAPDCDCSTPESSCDLMCTKLRTCLKHDAGSRYQNITTGDPTGICPVLCHAKWCRDTFDGDKTLIVNSEIMHAMCTNSTNTS